MARAVNLATLQQRVYRRAGMVSANPTNVNVYPTAECTDDINEGIAEFWDKFRGSAQDELPIKSAPWSTRPSNQNQQNLPDSAYIYKIGEDIPAQDFLEFRGLDVTFGNSSTQNSGNQIVITAKRFQWKERNKYKWWPTWVYSQPIFYAVKGNEIFLNPPPGGQFSCLLWYTPTSKKLINANDTFDGIAGWEEYAVLFAANRALMKQERFEHAAQLAALKEEIGARIEGLADRRDVEEPPRVSDVYLNDGYVGRPGYIFNLDSSVDSFYAGRITKFDEVDDLLSHAY